VLRQDLMDRFAAAALQGMLSYDGNNGYPSPRLLAARAYEYAAAMLAERDRLDKEPSR
jgi:hypothetical protein